LRVILEGVEAKERERVWIKNQQQGELDDAKIVDGVTGERNIYKTRGNADPLFGRLQLKPKRLRFVMDVSSSMARFDAEDGRLMRTLATTVLIIEAFHGFTHKYDYSIVGHSGDTSEDIFVDFGKPPRTPAEKYNVLRNMYAATRCMSGDNTLAGSIRAVQRVTEEPGDDYFVFVLSDANLAGYGVSARSLTKALCSDKRVNSFVVFIADDGVARSIKENMPAGRVHIVLDTAGLPKLFKEMFQSSLLKGKSSL